jgi:hypothetical protein
MTVQRPAHEHEFAPLVDRNDQLREIEESSLPKQA